MKKANAKSVWKDVFNAIIKVHALHVMKTQTTFLMKSNGVSCVTSPDVLIALIFTFVMKIIIFLIGKP